VRGRPEVARSGGVCTTRDVAIEADRLTHGRTCPPLSGPPEKVVVSVRGRHDGDRTVGSSSRATDPVVPTEESRALATTGEGMSDSEDPRLTVVCTDGTTIGCTNFTAKRTGLLLTSDLERNEVFGFVANDEVRFVLPTGTAEAALRGDEGGFEDPLMALPGVGSTYAERLRSAGYDSVAAVAGSDAAALADATGARESETERWVERAAERTDG
jgi:hypothetical protein